MRAPPPQCTHPLRPVQPPGTPPARAAHAGVPAAALLAHKLFCKLHLVERLMAGQAPAETMPLTAKQVDCACNMGGLAHRAVPCTTTAVHAQMSFVEQEYPATSTAVIMCGSREQQTQALACRQNVGNARKCCLYDSRAGPHTHNITPKLYIFTCMSQDRSNPTRPRR